MNGERGRVQGKKKTSIKEDPFPSRRRRRWRHRVGRAMVGKVIEEKEVKEKYKKKELRWLVYEMVGEIFSVERIMGE